MENIELENYDELSLVTEPETAPETVESSEKEDKKLGAADYALMATAIVGAITITIKGVKFLAKVGEAAVAGVKAWTKTYKETRQKQEKEAEQSSEEPKSVDSEQEEKETE